MLTRLRLSVKTREKGSEKVSENFTIVKNGHKNGSKVSESITSV